MSGLTQEVRSICQQTYDGTGKGCGKCPIRPECHNGTGTLTVDSLNAWRSRLNNAALTHLGLPTTEQHDGQVEQHG